MTKKIRKAIVFSLVYELVVFILVLGNSNQAGGSGDLFLALLVLSIPVIYYWARMFIKSGR